MILFISVAIIYIGAVIIFAQLKSPEEYNPRENTISELACQNYELNYIMQWGFKGFGLIIFTGIVVYRESLLNELYFTIPLAVYALGILLSGFFSTKPFEHLVFYSVKESKLHSFCAQLAGLSISLLVVMKFIIASGTVNRVINGAVLLFILYTSSKTVKANPKRGVYQRILYLGTFVWLIYAYSGMMK